MKRRTLGSCAIVVLAASACGGANASGSAVGKVGQGLSGRALGLPQGAEVCALKEGLAAQSGGPEKSIADACTRPLKDDQLWRRSIMVLSIYGESLDSIASGNNTDTSGQLFAARTGIEGKDWIQVDGAPEQAARDAAATLVDQMRTNGAKGKLEKAVKDASPSVKTLCDGISTYFEEQARGFGDVEKEIEKRRAAKADRRCTTLDNKPLCVSDSATDRIVYSHTLGQLIALESSHTDAHEAIAAFCAAHRALEDAAGKGKLSDDSTYAEVISAVKSARAAQPAPAATPPKK